MKDYSKLGDYEMFLVAMFFLTLGVGGTHEGSWDIYIKATDLGKEQ